MCGRYTLTAPSESLAEMLPGLEITDENSPRYNIAPTQEVAVVPNNGENRMEHFRWGLIPSWAKDPKIGNRMINARSETLAEKPSFRTAYKRRRCLVLADGYYEWRGEEESGTKNAVLHPNGIRQTDSHSPVCGNLGGQAGEDTSLQSCTIITCPPNEMIGAHSRPDARHSGRRGV